jgi:hypothetical protein
VNSIGYTTKYKETICRAGKEGYIQRIRREDTKAGKAGCKEIEGARRTLYLS